MGDCLECKAGQYLNITNQTLRTGNCTDKLNEGGTFDIYVSNLINENIEIGMQRSGTFDDPFAQLSDALKKAKGLASPYKNKVEVTIHLFAGDHFVVEDRRDAINIYYEKEAIDVFQLNLALNIKPLSCSHDPETESDLDIASICTDTDTVTFYNKIRERF